MTRIGLCLLAIVLTAGCSSDKPEAGASNAGNEFMSKMIVDDLPAIRTAVGSSEPSSASIKCAQVENLADARKSGKNMEGLAEYEKLCTTDLPLATLKVELDKIEAARKAKPDEAVLSECYNANYTTALEALAKFKHEDLAKGYVARFTAACPAPK